MQILLHQFARVFFGKMWIFILAAAVQVLIWLTSFITSNLKELLDQGEFKEEKAQMCFLLNFKAYWTISERLQGEDERRYLHV